MAPPYPATPSKYSTNDITHREHDEGSSSKRVQNMPINAAGCVSGTLSNIGTSAVEVFVSGARLAERRGVYIKNTSIVVLKWGFAANACVHPLAAEASAGDGKGGDIWIDVGDAQAVFILAVSGTTNTASVSELK